MTRRLGKGLGDIIVAATPSAENFVMLRTEQIKAGRFQPRTTISESSLEELKASIKRQGVVQPVLVRPIAHGTYELVAGERRWRAAQALGMAQVPAIVKTLSDQQALEFSLVENVQREDLNPIEEARGYARLLDEFGYTQEEVSAGVGKDRATVANVLRLLKLPAEIQDALGKGAVTLGHAKVLLSIEGRANQLAACARVVRGGLSVRQLEAITGAGTTSSRRRARRLDPELKRLEDALRQALGTKVSVLGRRKGGRIVIDYFSSEDLTRILQLVGASV